MRVDQRMGRIDRLGQPSERVYVINYYFTMRQASRQRSMRCSANG